MGSPSKKVTFETVALDKLEYFKDIIKKYKIPEFVELVSEFLRIPMGKVMKKELRRMEQENQKKA